jgi:hypothetical protein
MSTTLKLHVGSRVDSSYTVSTGDPENPTNVVESAQLSFYVDYADGANKEWASATPVANLNVTVLREIADKNGWTPGVKVTATLG